MKKLAKGSLSIVLVLALALSGCSMSWVQIALNDLPVLIQIATSIAGIVGAAQGNGQVDPAVAAQIATISAQVKSDLQLVQGLVSAYKAAVPADQPAIAAKISASLASVQTNLQALLDAFHVKNAALQTTIATSLGLAITTVLAIETLIPAPTPAAKAVKAVKPPSSKDLKNAFNAIVNANGYSQFALN